MGLTPIGVNGNLGCGYISYGYVSYTNTTHIHLEQKVKCS